MNINMKTTHYITMLLYWSAVIGALFYNFLLWPLYAVQSFSIIALISMMYMYHKALSIFRLVNQDFEDLIAEKWSFVNTPSSETFDAYERMMEGSAEVMATAERVKSVLHLLWPLATLAIVVTVSYIANFSTMFTILSGMQVACFVLICIGSYAVKNNAKKLAVLRAELAGKMQKLQKKYTNHFRFKTEVLKQAAKQNPNLN
jgi:hypothetical protein